ncbi:DUF624 domain-containing protein [Acidaminobacter sp. JC074]|uniref:DUF624 domain-containing protein n=1 Tax=Acidaminobacter sp. JC074 TaxID=2530199 RepID=UPI001F0E9142|nr:DUF624 domain-containing protein [Acidaminobacter sp. JC074]MCH4885950.1 DUF624 domain-containing protein [Acidaminobacter sp. JC074]
MNMILKLGEKAYGLIIINVLIILASIPLVTILPAISAGKVVTDAWIKDDQISIYKTFYEAFKGMFISGVLRTFVLGFWGITLVLLIKSYFGTSVFSKGMLLFFLLEWWLILIGSLIAFYEGKMSFTDAFQVAHTRLLDILLISITIGLSFLVLMNFNWLITIFIPGVMVMMYYMNRGIYARRV